MSGVRRVQMPLVLGLGVGDDVCPPTTDLEHEVALGAACTVDATSWSDPAWL